MRAIGVGLALACALLASTAAAQPPVTFDLSLAPTRATVGDRLTLTIAVQHPEGARIDVPDEADAFAPLELVEVVRPQSRELGGGRQETRFQFVLAAFATGEARGRPLAVSASFDGQEVRESLSLPPVMIESVLSAGEEPRPRDLKGPLDIASVGGEWVWAALVTAGFVALTALTGALARYAVVQRPPALALAPEPPDAVARRELDGIEGAGLVARGELEDYYRRLGAALRRYLSERYRIPAAALTAGELELRLAEAGVDRWPARLAANLLRQCDAVQFARYEPAFDRAEADLGSAYEVIELTRPVEGAVRSDRRREAVRL